MHESVLLSKSWHCHCRSKLWTYHCFCKSLCYIVIHCAWNTCNLVTSVWISQHACDYSAWEKGPYARTQDFCQNHWDLIDCILREQCMHRCQQNHRLFRMLLAMLPGIDCSSVSVPFWWRLLLLCTPGKSVAIHSHLKAKDNWRKPASPCQAQMQSQGSNELPWAIVTEHFVSYQFVHAFEYVTFRTTQWHKRFPVLLGYPIELLSLVRIFVWRCQPTSAMLGNWTLTFFIRNRNRWLVTCRYKNNGLLFLIDVFWSYPSSDSEEE